MWDFTFKSYFWLFNIKFTDYKFLKWCLVIKDSIFKRGLTEQNGDDWLNALRGLTQNDSHKMKAFPSARELGHCAT